MHELHSSRSFRSALSRSLLLAFPLLAACGGEEPASEPPLVSTRADLLDPVRCGDCHPGHYKEWAGSMHAYAADDPLFLAMNKRGQEETGGKLGTFCVNCHAPMAVKEGVTDGTNVEALPRHLKGVTCYFCHNIASIEADHNNLITLYDDLTMRGSIKDPKPNNAHRSEYSEFTDRGHLKSSEACGACHDLRLTQDQFGRDVHLERTFFEWRQTIFNEEGSAGQRCGDCHMRPGNARQPIADVPGAPDRVFHPHTFPGVDVALTPFPAEQPQNELQQELVQDFLDTSLVTEVCVSVGVGVDGAVIRVLLDNAAAGHNWPSGASQDRRAWVDIKAYVTGQSEPIYKTNEVAPGTSVADAAKAGPEFWFFGDQAFKADGTTAAHMFWDVVSVQPQTISGTTKENPLESPHVVKRFPVEQKLQQIPDRVDVNIHIRAMDVDVLDDLIGTGHLDPAFRNSIPTLTLLPNRGSPVDGADVTLRWTRELARGPEGYEITLRDEGLRLECFQPGGRVK